MTRLGLAGFVLAWLALACGGADKQETAGGGASGGSGGSGGTGGGGPIGNFDGGDIKNDLGPAPGGDFVKLATLEVRNDRAVARVGETAFSAIPVAKDKMLLDTAGLAVVDKGRLLQAQFTPIARWGGAVDDAKLPIRWLAVAVGSHVAPNATTSYELRRYGSFAAPADPLATRLSEANGVEIVETGVARFELKGDDPSLFQAIAVDVGGGMAAAATAYDGKKKAGPRLVLDDGTVLDVAGGNVAVDKDGFEIVEQGPVRVVVKQRGHFIHPSHPDVHPKCTDNDEAYDRFGYSLLATFTRGSRDVALQFEFRNECSTAFNPPWTDQAVRVSGVSYELPLAEAAQSVLFATSAEVKAAGGKSAVVEQTKAGDEKTWKKRKARATIDGKEAEAAETVERPLVAAIGAKVAASLQMPWMRYREPQAIAFENGALSLRVVSDKLIVGEAVGIWSFGKFRFYPAGEVADPAKMTVQRDLGWTELERGLLVHVPSSELDAAAIYPPMTATSSSLVKKKYEGFMQKIHEDTVKPGGQWDRAKTYGSQLWPDIQYDPFAYEMADQVPTPYANGGNMNYWNPSGAELLEFLRTGDPKWVWDFALPQSYTQIFDAYINIGEHAHGNRNGFCAISGGTGEGQWHRSGFGSADYSYNQGLDEAYVIRPDALTRDRFRQMGRTVIDEFNLPKAQEQQRDDSQYVAISRFYVQRYDGLQNCAEFAPGERGKACLAKLAAIMDELANDNLSAGEMCGDDIPSATCGLPQAFMVNSMMYPSFTRYYRDYGDVAGKLRRALVRTPYNLYAYGFDKKNGEVDPTGCWVSEQVCQLNADRSDVVGCKSVPDSDNLLCMYDHNRAQAATLLLLAGGLDPATGLCAVGKKLLDAEVLYGGLDDYAQEGGDPGWFKGNAQMMQSLVFAPAGYDSCK